MKGVIKTTHASDESVAFVLDHLWDRGRQELDILGITPEVAMGMIAQQRQAGLPTMAIWVDNEPVVISGLLRLADPLGMVTWFQATDLFAGHARAITKELRAKLAFAASMYDLAYIEINSPCTHPDTGRWFGALGFHLDVDRFIRVREGSEQRLYRFVRHFDRSGDVLPQA